MPLLPLLFELNNCNSLIKPSRVKPAGSAIIIKGVVISGCPTAMKVVGVSMSNVLIDAKTNISYIEDSSNVPLILEFTAELVTYIQPNPELSINKVAERRAAFFLSSGTQLVKK